MTRNGKIARLPTEVREELNERLDDGEEGKELVKWLNSLPEVQNRIRFGLRGKAITEQNLSQWKNGGYRDWQAKQERWDLMFQLRDDAVEEAQKIEPEETLRHLSQMLTLELARASRDLLEQTSDPKERIQGLNRLIGRFTQLRREECHARRTEMVLKKREREVEEEDERRWRAEQTLRRLSEAPLDKDSSGKPAQSVSGEHPKPKAKRRRKEKSKGKTGRNNVQSHRIKVDRSEKVKKSANGSTVQSPQSTVGGERAAEPAMGKENGDGQDGGSTAGVRPTGVGSAGVDRSGSKQIKAEAVGENRGAKEVRESSARCDAGGDGASAPSLPSEGEEGSSSPVRPD